MGIIDARHVTRFEIPHEPGEWIGLHRISGGQVRKIMKQAGDGADRAVAILRASLDTWSYPCPITDETLDDVDYQTLLWMVGVATTHSAGLSTRDEKKDEMPPLTGS